MADIADCCGCCLLCCTCFSLCGRCCFWIPCPGDTKRAKDIEGELYVQQVVQENYLLRVQQPPHYSADYRGPPQPQGQDPMVPGRNSWTTEDPSPDQLSGNFSGRGVQPYSSGQPPDALRPPPGSYQAQQTHQYPPQHDPRASFMSGITLQGPEEPGQQPQGGQNANDIGHRSNRSGQYSQQEIESAHRNEGTQQ